MAASSIIVFLAGIRATGSKDATGITYGGNYFPAHMKNGKQVAARWEGNFIANSPDWTDDNGVRHEGSKLTVRVVGWNSPNSAPGKGLADIMAKNVSVGKEISAQFRLNNFQKRMFFNGQPLTRPDGQVLTYPAMSFIVKEGLRFGQDSAKTIAAEIARWNGTPSFDSRPAQWNIPGTPDNEAWKNIMAQRNAAVFNPTQKNYGYARVIVPEGAQLIQPGMATNTGAAPTEAGAVINAGLSQQGLTPPAGGTAETASMMEGTAGTAGTCMPL